MKEKLKTLWGSYWWLLVWILLCVFACRACPPSFDGFQGARDEMYK